MTYDKIKSMEKEGELREHHTAYKRGYVSRIPGNEEIYEYNGRFGKGYAVETPAFHTTVYHWITYYIFAD